MSTDSLNYRLVFSKFRENYGRVIFTHYFLAPLGIITILFFAYLVDLLFDLLPFTFPAQAICMILLFLLLVLLHKISPHFLFHHVYTFLHPAADFLLACMGLFFTSSFVLIPRRDAMPGKEIGLIAALFLPTFLITWIGTVCIVKALAHLFPRSQIEDSTEDNNADVLDESESGSIRSSSPRSAQFSDSHPRTSPDSIVNAEAGECNQGSTHAAEKPRVSHSSDQNKRTNLALDQNLTIVATETADVPDDSEKPSRFFLSKLTAKTKEMFQADSTTEDDSLSREERLAGKLAVWFDPAVYFLVLLIGLPLFYTPGGEKRSLPLFTGVVSLAWLFSRRTVPAKWQVLLHPILVTSFITVFVVWAFGAIKGMSLSEVLNHYSTGSTYQVLFRRDQGWNGTPPGAGDLLTSLLVGGIVALAFPMFRYRHDLYSNYLRLLVVVAPNCVISLLFWPWLANQMGIAGDRAITFAGRFMSTPFGIQFIVATGGDSSLIVVLICITGILAVLIRDPLFRLCRTRTTPGSDEYFTIGCTIGIVAAAIGTSSLMVSHSRAAATSTVTFVLYGLVLLALVAVPSIANYVAKLAGM